MIMRTSNAYQAKSWQVLLVSPQQNQSSAPLQHDCIATQVPAIHSLQAQLFSVWQQHSTNDWFVVQVCQLSGNKAMPHSFFEAHFLPSLEAMVKNCDAILRQGGMSVAADELLRDAIHRNVPVFEDWNEFKKAITKLVLGPKDNF
jgi:hypothetical protein